MGKHKDVERAVGDILCAFMPWLPVALCCALAVKEGNPAWLIAAGILAWMVRHG